MCQIAVEDSSWLMVDSWECSRSEYSPTFLVMEHFRRQMDSFYGDRVQLAFVCGSDLYHSLFDPEIWPKEHVCCFFFVIFLYMYVERITLVFIG
jgi:nicotinamide mononucleotide adenylyltransferase